LRRHADEISADRATEDGHVFKRAEAEAAMEELLTGRVETPEIVRLLRHSTAAR